MSCLDFSQLRRGQKKNIGVILFSQFVSATLQPDVDLEKDGIFLEIQIYPTALIATARFPALFEISLYFRVLKESRYRKLPIISPRSI